MKFLRSEQRVRNGYFGAFALLILIYAFVFFSMLQMAKRFGGMDRGYNVIWNLKLLTAYLNQADATLKNYTTVNKQAYLDSISVIENRADSVLLILYMLKPNSKGENKTDTLRRLVQNRFDFLHTVVEISNAKDSVSKRPVEFLADQEVNSFKIRSLINNIEASEKVVFSKGKSRLNVMSGFFLATNVIGFFFSLVLGYYAFTIYNKENYAKRIYRRQLEEGIEQLKATNHELNELRSIEKFAVSGRISRTIAHEIRNPLTNINLACEQINVNLDPDSHVLIDMIKRNSKRINDLITDLLNSTKFSELNPKKVFIHTILDQALQLAGDRIDLNGIKINKDYAVPREVEIDPEKMKIAFLNIIINAIEAMQPGEGVLDIKITNRPQHCLITIKDNGSGMDKDSLLRIFEPYFTSKNEGNGLGLTHTQNIILNHKGKINVSSTPGYGTTFFIEVNYNLVYQSYEQNGYT
jgi:signal transduction histidine kinase